MYISSETDEEGSKPAPAKHHIDLAAVKRALDRQAEEERVIPPVLWVVVSPALLLIVIVLIVSS